MTPPPPPPPPQKKIAEILSRGTRAIFYSQWQCSFNKLLHCRRSMCKFLCRRMSCAGSATSSEKVAEILKTLKEDSQIDYYEVITILNLDTQQIAPDFDDSFPPPPPLKKK